ncbi:MAG: hypothetical protein KDB22_03445 [Planctomycetales bacterium]|nr:hypothetical protein [Planctomycetales bacterium]
MSAEPNLLDELFIANGELLLCDPLHGDFSTNSPKSASPPGIMNSLGVSNRLAFSHSLIVRNVSPPETATWTGLCRSLKNQRIPIYTSAASMNDLPNDVIPTRCCQVFANAPLDAPELTTADLIEIECFDRRLQRWGWSAEIGRQRLADFVTAVRLGCGGNAAVGVGLPITANALDVQACLDADIDFLCLTGEAASISAQDLVGLSAVRHQCRSSSRAQLPIVVDLPVLAAADMVKLLCLGASLVCIDHWLTRRLPKKQAAHKATGLGADLLRSLPTASSDEEKVAALDEALTQLAAAVRCHFDQTRFAGDKCYDHLRTSSLALHKMLGIPLLQARSD